MSVQDSESRRFEQTFGWVFLRPTGIIFFGVFEKFETFFSKICAHSERYRNLLAGIFEILTFYGNIAFPLSPVLDVEICSCVHPYMDEASISSFCVIRLIPVSYTHLTLPTTPYV